MVTEWCHEKPANRPFHCFLSKSHLQSSTQLRSAAGPALAEQRHVCPSALQPVMSVRVAHGYSV